MHIRGERACCVLPADGVESHFYSRHVHFVVFLRQAFSEQVCQASRNPFPQAGVPTVCALARLLLVYLRASYML